jgi:3-hydroxybutyryl-CoA dehydrogenase
MEAMSYVLAGDVDERPVLVVGGGTLGRRIALMFSAGGSRVHLFSRSAGSLGTVELFGALEPAVATAWLVVESVSEDLALKKQVFGELDRLAERCL